MSGDREQLLARVTEALRVPAPRHHEVSAQPRKPSVTAPFRERSQDVVFMRPVPHDRSAAPVTNA